MSFSFSALEFIWSKINFPTWVWVLLAVQLSVGTGFAGYTFNDTPDQSKQDIIELRAELKALKATIAEKDELIALQAKALEEDRVLLQASLDSNDLLRAKIASQTVKINSLTANNMNLTQMNAFYKSRVDMATEVFGATQ